MADAFIESDTILYRQSVTFQTGFGVIADAPFSIGSLTSTNSNLITYNLIYPYGGISGYTPSGNLTGLFYPLNNNVSGYITTGQTGAFGGGGNTGILTGAFYPLVGNPSGFITTSQTGNFYPASNPNNYSTGYSSSINYTNTINWSSGTCFYTTLAGNTTFTFTGYKDGQSINVSVTNTGINFFSGIWPSYVKWPYKIIPVQSSGAYTDIYTFINITGGIYGSAVQGF